MKQVQLGRYSITPSKIVCVGRNYVDHIKELNNDIPDEMVIFMKPNSAISTQLLAYHDEALHYEAELCFMYQSGRFSAVAIGLDLTKRALQSQLKNKGLPWEKAKAFDGSAIFSDFVPINDIDESLSFSLSVDGELIQEGHVGLMIHSPQSILAHVLTFMSLEEGDIVMTGTPKGVGQVTLNSHYSVQMQSKGETVMTKEWMAVSS
ncbi:fumarylacetoacetate hydrolase family protein [Shewanella surugensis]|uniref:Fumarylacetoacetate hydrolase family protein n=1 Tax=Shewanella surugensis TaxID=212020 RepID=A0ABT0LBE6_9GAMM|nr:fumarylacetoacetate hydrolase family protein [Shewanella surugensis]MCL1125028.1 fumarylacetoacetate hydrolase family protein [Shewanella surugensis]